MDKARDAVEVRTIVTEAIKAKQVDIDRETKNKWTLLYHYHCIFLLDKLSVLIGFCHSRCDTDGYLIARGGSAKHERTIGKYRL